MELRALNGVSLPRTEIDMTAAENSCYSFKRRMIGDIDVLDYLIG